MRGRIIKHYNWASNPWFLIIINQVPKKKKLLELIIRMRNFENHRQMNGVTIFWN